MRNALVLTDIWTYMYVIEPVREYEASSELETAVSDSCDCPECQWQLFNRLDAAGKATMASKQLIGKGGGALGRPSCYTYYTLLQSGCSRNATI